MKVSVTAEDIRRGCRESCYACPIALALNRAYDCVSIVDCDSVSLGFVGDDLFELPEVAVTFISDFDAGRRVQPFDFDFPYDPEPLEPDNVEKRPAERLGED